MRGTDTKWRGTDPGAWWQLPDPAGPSSPAEPALADLGEGSGSRWAGGHATRVRWMAPPQVPRAPGSLSPRLLRSGAQVTQETCRNEEWLCSRLWQRHSGTRTKAREGELWTGSGRGGGCARLEDKAGRALGTQGIVYRAASPATPSWELVQDPESCPKIRICISSGSSSDPFVCEILRSDT